jgi:uncharacterized protein
MKDIIVILSKFPQNGKVKSRLVTANKISETEACHIYHELLENTITFFESSNKELCLSVSKEDKMQFQNSEFKKYDIIERDISGNIGQVILIEFEEQIKRGFDRIIISVSDVIYDNLNVVDIAFDSLLNNDVILGKSLDGGFYLIGMKEAINIFSNVVWSTKSVFGQVIENCKSKNLKVSCIEPISEIDIIDDIVVLFEKFQKDTALQLLYPNIWEKAKYLNS